MADLDLCTPLLSAVDLAEESNVSVAYPLLVLAPPPGPDRSPYKLFSLPDQKLQDVTPLVSSKKKVWLATPQGWVLVLSSSDSSSDDAGTYLLNTMDGSRIELPDDEASGACRCVLSNTVAAPGCGVLVFDLASPVMWFCRRNFFDVAAVNGRFFFCESKDSLGTLDFHTGGASGEPEARLGDIASCNDLFLVHIAFHGVSVDRLGEFHVYRMDFSDPPAWRKTDCIGDRGFLLGDSNFAASYSASECGLKPNCVYWVNCFSEENSDLHVLGLRDGSSEIVKRFDNVLGVHKPFWVVPVDA
ncbi:hypothetical protein VPH35_096060 [Triticum aestivum]